MKKFERLRQENGKSFLSTRKLYLNVLESFDLTLSPPKIRFMFQFSFTEHHLSVRPSERIKCNIILSQEREERTVVGVIDECYRYDLTVSGGEWDCGACLCWPQTHDLVLTLLRSNGTLMAGTPDPWWSPETGQSTDVHCHCLHGSDGSRWPLQLESMKSSH